MKENINPIENALEKISKLGGYTFNYKGNDTPMTGVMAQELMDVLPGVVYEVEDPKSGETVYAVRHGNIIGLLIEAIKELKNQMGK
jgi:broad specificity phosphatase PhoE